MLPSSAAELNAFRCQFSVKRSTKLKDLFDRFVLAVSHAEIPVPLQELYFHYVDVDKNFTAVGKYDNVSRADDLKANEKFYKLVAVEGPSSKLSRDLVLQCDEDHNILLDNLYADMSFSEFVSAALAASSISAESGGEDSKSTLDDFDSYGDVIGTYTFGSLYDSLTWIFSYELKCKPLISLDKHLRMRGVMTNPTLRSRGREGPFEELAMLPCEFCNDVFPVAELVGHQMACAGNPK